MHKWTQRARKRWRKVLDDHAQSGLSVARFCRENDVPQSAFYQWRKKFRVEEDSQTTSDQSLVPITIVGSPMVEFEFPHGVIMRVPIDDQQMLRQVIGILQAGGNAT